MTAATESDQPEARVLEMSNVTVSRLRDPAAVVLKDVSWSVGTGDYWLVAGRHHSGKTDFMLTAAGLMPPRAGTCRIMGSPQGPGEEFTNARRRVGLAFDGGQLLSHLTVAENIALPIAYHRNCPIQEVADDVEPLLELVELTWLAKSKPASIGRNWRQRAGLARALALKPDALLLDNPLSALDPLDLAWWLDLLDDLSAGHQWMAHRPITLIVTGADLRPWQGHARQFALIKDQRLVVTGDAEPGTLQADPLWEELAGKRSAGVGSRKDDL
jgi:ABC-type transporter Mla maintaining outer membrane lipid asymmetry ATPase subunit MlaF